MNAPAPKLPEPTGGTPSPPPAAASPPAPPPSKTPAAPPPAATPAPKSDGKSIYEVIGEPEPGKEGSSAWPTDWREQLAQEAGPDASKVLARYQSPADVAKALLAAQQKIRSGEYKRAMPASDNPEELKAWREEQGIPDSPEGYELPHVEGVDLANLDPDTKANLDILRTGLHTANLNKDQAATVSRALLDLASRQTEALAEADAQRMDAIEDSLRAEWGTEYRRNLNMNAALLTQHFGDEMESVLKARMADGTRLADHPGFNKFLNAMARANGTDVMFDGDVKGGTSIDTRLEQIRQVMATNINEYYAKGLDKEYAQLLEKKEARGGR